jgi:hypothetical protein
MKEIKFVLSLMTPRVWLVLLVAAALVLVAGLGVGGYVGYRVADDKAEIAALKVQGERATERLNHAAALAVETGKVNALTAARRTDIDTIALTHQKEMDHAKATIDGLRADVLTGAVRLSVAVKARPAACGNAPGQDPAAAGGDQETRAELMPQVAYDLIGIVADGDAAVLDLNACIDAYHAIEKAQP